MSYDELIEKAGRKLDRIQNFDATVIPRQPTAKGARGRFESMLRHTPEGSTARRVNQKIADAESAIRRVRATALPGAEKRAETDRIVARLIKQVEAETATAINRTVQKLDTLAKQYAEKQGDAVAQLLALERAKLRYAQVDERGAVAKLQAMTTRGYTEPELEVLGSKGVEAAREAQRVRTELPPAIANDEGLRLLDRLDQLAARKPGDFSVEIEGAEHADTLNVADLIEHVSPSINDTSLRQLHAKPEPEAEPEPEQKAEEATV